MDEKTIPLSKLPVDVKVQISGKNKMGADLDYRALFEQTGECVFIIGLDFKFITANQQALRLLGYEEGQLTGLPVEEIMAFQDSQEREILLEKRQLPARGGPHRKRRTTQRNFPPRLLS